MHKDYSHYSANDFIADDFFKQWVQNPTPEHSAFWEAWIQQHTNKQAEITEAVNFLGNIRFQTDFPTEQEIEYALRKQLHLIDAIVDVHDHQPRHTITPRIFSWMAAIIFSALLFFAGWYFWQPGNVTIETVTGEGEIKNIALPDSSYVTLNSNSTLRYGSNIYSATPREVWLKGEAYFEVRPSGNLSGYFIVHCDEIDVEVAGTAFNIRKYRGNINVSLDYGKIKVALKNDPGSILYLQQGDFVQYSDDDKYLLKKQVKTEMYSGWRKEKLQLIDLPFEDLAVYLHDVFKFDCRMEGEQVKNISFTGTLLLKNEQSLLGSLSALTTMEIIRSDRLLIFKQKKKKQVHVVE
ncbi:MAG TPA: FecR domain-containing protein [Flavitalea sp.]|nr:FecR domain-containing protein [Flavitalea sp.]